MENALKKLSAEVKKNLEEALGTVAFKDLITRTKDASDSGTFEVVISTADTDRSGEIVLQEGMETDMYLKNPIVLFGHDYYSLPIGICTSLELIEGKRVAKGTFAPADANPFAQQVRKLYDLGIIRATSVGFIVKEMEGNTITKSELLEFSFVPVPANPHALSLPQAKSLGFDIPMLAMKGITNVVKAEGDTCTLDDDTEGVINAEGVCVAKPVEEAAAEEGEEKKVEETETKGALADEVVDEDAWELKWEKAEELNEIINAFFNVYFNEETKVEAFEGLVAEMIELMTPFANGTAVEEDAKSVKKFVGHKDTKTFIRTKAEDEIIKKVGAALNAMNATVDTTITDASKEIVAILGGSTEQESEEEDVAEEGDEKSGGVTLEGEATKEFDSFIKGRELLRAVATATTNALEEMNKRARERTR